jgi:hypothetical protein
MTMASFQDRLYRRVNRNEIGPREEKAPDLFEKLLRMGLTPEEANQTVSTYSRTGDFNPPAYRERPPDPNDAGTEDNFGPTRTRVRPLPSVEQLPYNTGKKRQQLYTFDKSKGSYGVPVDVPDNVDAVTVNQYESDPKNGQDIFVDAGTGKELRREPNGTKANKVIKVGSTQDEAADEESVKAARETHKRYLAKLAQKDAEGNPVPIPEDLAAEMESAAPLLGMTMEDVAAPKEGFLRKAARAVAPGFVAPAPQGYRRPVFGKNGENTGKAGKNLSFSSEEEAVAANLPKGTIVTINGRRARID